VVDAFAAQCADETFRDRVRGPLPVFAQLAWTDLALLFGHYLINPLGGAFG
jgi:hypothetical protein